SAVIAWYVVAVIPHLVSGRPCHREPTARAHSTRRSGRAGRKEAKCSSPVRGASAPITRQHGPGVTYCRGSCGPKTIPTKREVLHLCDGAFTVGFVGGCDLRLWRAGLALPIGMGKLADAPSCASTH